MLHEIGLLATAFIGLVAFQSTSAPHAQPGFVLKRGTCPLPAVRRLSADPGVAGVNTCFPADRLPLHIGQPSHLVAHANQETGLVGAL